MIFWRKLLYLLPSYRRARERDMQEELESIAALAGPGVIGNKTGVAEQTRAVWGWDWFEHLLADIRYAFRATRRNPGFTATAVLSLALGIGANTAIFNLMDALMLRWLPVPNPGELVRVNLRAHGGTEVSDSFSYSMATALADRKDIFSGACGFSGASFNIGPRASLHPVSGAYVTGDYYQTLGLNPESGRLLTRADDQPGATLVAVLSDGYWQRQYSRNPGVIGQTIRVNGVPVTVAGVSPSGFTGANVGAVADITLPVAALARIAPEEAVLLGPGNFWLRILARPRSGVSTAQIQAHLAAAWPSIAESTVSHGWPASRRKEITDSTPELVPGGTGYTYLREMFQKPLVVLLGVSLLVLLIACANVASLLLARATARSHEISIRLSIGASRPRLVRQLFTESVLLSLTGAAAGVVLAWPVSRFLLSILSGGENSQFPIVFDLSPNGHVFAFAGATAVFTAVLFGLAPAFRTTSIKDASHTTRYRSRALSALVSGQVALSLTLLIGAGLFVRTLQNLMNVDPGFRREGVLLVDVDGRTEGYQEARLTAFYQDLLQRVRRIPGVVSVSLSGHTPLSGWTWSEAAVPQGQPLPERDNAIFVAAGPGYFATLGTPLLSGREFNEYDTGAEKVAIVNQAFVDRYFHGRNPEGAYLTATVTRPPGTLRIVGVAANVINTGDLRTAPKPTVYVSYAQGQPARATIIIRAAGALSQIAAAVRAELQPAFPSSPLEIGTLAAQVERTVVQERLMANLASGFGALGLALASVGLYGLLSYSVVRRTREIGVRMALGAKQSRVLWMVVGNATRLLLFGVALGVPAAWAASQLVRTMLFGLTPADPAIIAAAILLLCAAGLLAAYLPARRAALVDPMTALRHE